MITIFLYFISILYLLFMIWLLTNQRKLNQISTLSSETFTIIVPFKNEREVLPQLIQSLSNLTYKHYKVILVNDHSSDYFEETLPILPENFELIQNNGDGKKSALTTGIKHARTDWIVTTDADCNHPANWLQSIALQTTNHDMIIGLVMPYIQNTKWWQRFYELEYLSTQALTVATANSNIPIMCSGANLAFKKRSFSMVNGYNNHLSILSGDDVFLLYDFKCKGLSICVNSNIDSIVYTEFPTSIDAFFKQRIRWAGKGSKIKDKHTILIGLLMLFTNLTLGYALIMSFASPILIGVILLKFFSDFLFFNWSAPKLNIKNWKKSFLIVSIFYPFYLITVLLSSNLISVKWKESIT